MLLASSIKDTLCDVQWIYCNKMFCYSLGAAWNTWPNCVNIDTGRRGNKNFDFQTFPLSSSKQQQVGEKADKLEGGIISRQLRVVIQ